MLEITFSLTYQTIQTCRKEVTNFRFQRISTATGDGLKWEENKDRNIVHKYMRIYLWSCLLFLKKGSIKMMQENRYILFAGVIFISNFFVYWISPGSRQRYIYMLYPLLVTIFVYLFFNYYKDNKLIKNIINYLFGAGILVFSIACISLFKLLSAEEISRYKYYIAIAFIIYSNGNLV